MSDLLRFGVSIESELLESFDCLVAAQGYATRSEALRDLIRDALVRSRIEAQPQSADVLGSLTLVYDHHAHDLAEQMAALQHSHHGLVVSVLHVHISHDDCMEVIVLRGQAGEVRELADALLSLKGVKHGRLFVTLPAQHIASRKAVAVAAHEHYNHQQA
ncbi:MAG TPA: nickel-responsive transcriptional regulator NikR [Pyrinomonadaceae bacterium]|jgi:CopG family nickel-responsive transcriptional regulator|nr:nickel-responsive transcriptional regulator NikR [Pyrinomonadaceae bacterium]